jgi:hypothetical protein
MRRWRSAHNLRGDDLPRWRKSTLLTHSGSPSRRRAACSARHAGADRIREQTMRDRTVKSGRRARRDRHRSARLMYVIVGPEHHAFARAAAAGVGTRSRGRSAVSGRARRHTTPHAERWPSSRPRRRAGDVRRRGLRRDSGTIEVTAEDGLPRPGRLPVFLRRQPPGSRRRLRARARRACQDAARGTSWRSSAATAPPRSCRP